MAFHGTVHGCTCPAIATEDAEVSVIVEAKEGEGYPWQGFIGTGDTVNEAVQDGEDHAFIALGEDAWIGDWHAN